MSIPTSARAAVPVALALLAPLLVTLGVPVSSSAAAAAAPQRGSTSLSAPIVQPGRRDASSTKARLTGTVKFRPIRRGRPVIIQRRVPGGPWRKVAKRRQNGAGVVQFTAAAHTSGGTPYSYRGVARRWRGTRQFASRERSAATWSPVFREEFRGRSLGPQWRDRPAPSSSRKCSRVGDPRARSVGRGTLKLRVRLNPDRRGRTCRIRRGPDKGRYRYYLNGAVSTAHLPVGEGAFTRGTFAARIKFPRPRGQHGAFWLQPRQGQSDHGTAANSGAEIDVVEFFGQGYPQGGLASFLYNYSVRDRRGDLVKIGGMMPRATRMLPRRDAWWKRFHVFSLEWDRRSYTFSVDGRPHFRTRRGVSGVDEYLILSMLTSDWELRQAKRLGIRPRGTMQVDWARVWQK